MTRVRLNREFLFILDSPVATTAARSLDLSP